MIGIRKTPYIVCIGRLGKMRESCLGPTRTFILDEPAEGWIARLGSDRRSNELPQHALGREMPTGHPRDWRRPKRREKTGNLRQKLPLSAR